MTSRVATNRAWEFLLNCVYAEEMIAMAMGRVDRRQIFAAGCHPVDKFLVLIDRDGGIYSTASRLPEMSVEEMGDHFMSLAPGGNR